ncbi:hypothetical protein DSL72_005954 [Monilinia vaccinii-corymbosi]|uniref:Uncharacterized protein n=1 Tax=Monilinia vaccinii-corymbosi TaxID=61207 RepID=A0A8A3PH47_9HELO|nr:hypothetical protein DSL72_005954 [Monilinia vaccinii-corymbosi]
MEKQEHHEHTPPCRRRRRGGGGSVGRPPSLQTDLVPAAPPSLHPYPYHYHPYYQDPRLGQDYFNFHLPLAPPLAHYHHHQMNNLTALPPFPQYQPQYPSQYPPQPQPPNLLSPEHHYLHQTLAKENLKALSLGRKIAAAQASLAALTLDRGLSSAPTPTPTPAPGPAPPPCLSRDNSSTRLTRRKTQKYLSWLGCRARECARQEAILRAMLGQVVGVQGVPGEIPAWIEYGGGGGFGGAADGGNLHSEFVDADAAWGTDADPLAFQPRSAASSIVGNVNANGNVDANVSGRRCSNDDFWNVAEVPVFSPVDFLGQTAGRAEGGGGRLGRGRGRAWEDCEVSPLSPVAEEKVGGEGEDLDGEVEVDVEVGGGGTSASASGSREGSGNSSIESAITTPIPLQSSQSSQMTPMGGAKSCGDVELWFLGGLEVEGGGVDDGVDDGGDERVCLVRDSWGGEDRIGMGEGKGKGKGKGKRKSLPVLGSRRWVEG